MIGIFVLLVLKRVGFQKKKRTETNQTDAPKFNIELEKEYERFNIELEKVDGKEKKLDQLPADQEMKDANVEKCRICPKEFPSEEMNRHLVDHFQSELNLFASMSGPAMDEACEKCPAELGMIFC